MRTSLPLVLAVPTAALLGALTIGLGVLPPPPPAGAQEPPRRLEVPPQDLGATFLDARRQSQERAAADWAAFHDFRFADRLPESGITFVHRVVDDAARTHKLVHYDHGNGLLVADVDGDGELDLYFLSQIGANGLWRNAGDGVFEDVTAAAGVAVEDRVSVSGSFADADNDGDPDLFVTTVKMGNLLFENLGGGKFRDVTADSGLAYTGHSSGVCFFDYDGDGLLDLLVTNVGQYTIDAMAPGGFWVGIKDAFDGHLMPERAERSRIYRNLGGLRFEDASDALGFVDVSWTGDATVTDVDGDGRLDIYLLNMQGDDHLYLNRDGERFEEATAAWFPTTPWGTMGVEVLDLQNDGRLDLFLTDMHSDMVEIVQPLQEKRKAFMTWTEEYLADGSNNVFGNAFFVRREEGPFQEVSDAVGAENFWPWGLSAGDLNADGFEDVFVASSMNYPFRYGINSVLLNDRGERFVDAEFVLGVEPRRDGATKTPWFTLDCDGADAGRDLCSGLGGRLEVWGSLGTRSSALIDIDADGDLDIVTNEFGSAPQVLVSDLADRRDVRWLQVALTGTASNRDAIGARVRVVLPGRTLTQQVDGKTGYLSQSRVPLYFGLGDAESVERVEIDWPSGRTQVVTEGLTVRGRLEVTEPDE